MWFGVLGSLEARDDAGRTVPVRGSVRRLLLAALLCRAPAVVKAESLIDDLWGAVPPRSALKTLQSHVVRLRHDLGECGSTVIRTTGPGYRCDLSGSEIDVVSFEAALGEGLAALRREDWRLARTTLDKALGCWRAEAYLDFGDAAFAVAERVRLAELRAMAEEGRTDASLELGAAAELVGDLEVRVRRAPYRERSWEQLILALYRSGRQADALACCRTVRDTLAADLGVDPGPGLQVLRDRILRQDPILLAAPNLFSSPPLQTSQICPYRGLDGYGTQDAAVFVGRERLTALLAGRLADAGAVIVTGPSGSGKSSLVRAGLVPLLRAGAVPFSAAWRIEVGTPADFPPLAGDLDVLVVDQAEDLFTAMDVPARHGLVDRLLSWVHGGGRLVLVLRGDFFGRLAELPALARYAQSPVLIGPMREDELRSVVVEPARRAGIVVDQDVVDAVLDDAAGQPQPLPLVSLALVRTWERRTGNVMTRDDYQAGGGVAGAIEATAEAVYAGMDPEVQAQARRLLVRLAGREGSAWVRRPLPDSAAAGGPRSAAVEALAAGRLITVTASRIDLSHDFLLGHWPRLRDWLTERTAVADLLEHLTAASTAWVAAGRPAGDVYRGPRLLAALSWRAGHPEDVSAAESEFLDRSRAAADAELAQARERAAAERRGRRRLRWVVVGLAAAVVVALTVGLVAVRAQSSADQAALGADARRLAAQSLSAPDIASSALLAVAGYRIQDSTDTRGALLSTLLRSQSARFRIAMPHRVIRMVAASAGSLVYALDNSDEVRVVDTARRTIVTSFPGRASDLVAVARGGAQLVVAGPGRSDPDGFGRLSVLDAADGATMRVLTGTAMDGPAAPSMAPDGRWLVAVEAADQLAARPTRTVTVYDAQDWARPPRTLDMPAPVIDVAAGRDVAAIETTGHMMYLIDLATLHVLSSAHRTDLPTALPAGHQSPLAISPDGQHLAYLLPPLDTEPELIDTNHLAGSARPLPAGQQAVDVLRFAGDGSELALGSADGSVTVYRTADGRSVAGLAGHAGPVQGVTWGSTPQGPSLFTTGLDSQLISWDIEQTPGLLTMTGSATATADQAQRFGDDVVGVWPPQNVTTRESQERLFDLNLGTGAARSWSAGITDADTIDQVTATPDGSRALVAIENEDRSSRLQLWDLRHGALITTIAVPGQGMASISADGMTALDGVGFGTLVVIALPSGRIDRTIHVGFTGPGADRLAVEPVRYTPTGAVLLTGHDPGPQPPTPPGQPATATIDTAPPDERLGLLDVPSGRLTAEAGLGDVGMVTAVAWSNDAQTLAIGTKSGTITTYDAHTLNLQHSGGTAHAGFVLSTSFSPDDRTIVTAGTDGSMSFWDAATLSRQGSRVAVPIDGASWWYAWYTPDGNVSGLVPDLADPAVDDERRFTFPANPDTWAQLACSLAGADITAAQWAQYVGDRPYQSIC